MFPIDSAFGSTLAINPVSTGPVRQFSYVDDAVATISILRASPK